MIPYQFQTIHTLEARSNMLLEMTQKHFKLTDPQVFQMIQGLLRLLRPNSSPSFLFGDWLNGERSDMAFGKWLEWSPGAIGSVMCDLAHERYSPYYFAYLNNLTSADAVRIDRGFRGHPADLGCLNMDLDSPVKTYLSTCLIRDFIKHRKVIIKGHEDDRDAAEDHNLSFFDFEQFGLTVRSLPLMYYGVLLSYKIERLHQAQDGDRRFSLNALTPAPRMIDDFEVQLDEAKWKYLQDEKGGSLKRSGLAGLDAASIARRIGEKVNDNYIYRLARAMNGDTLKFNVMIEPVPGTRTECALKYVPQERALRVITLY